MLVSATSQIDSTVHIFTRVTSDIKMSGQGLATLKVRDGFGLWALTSHKMVGETS